MENEYRKLEGKTVVITGASSGAGRATALQMAREGANIVLAARREKALQEAAAECEVLGGRTKVVVTDVADAKAVAALAREAVEWGGGIDVWVNNAGVLAAGTFEETPVEIHDQVIRINLMGYIHGAHAVVPYFKAQGHGVLINNISVGGWLPTPYAVGYSASKFGLRAFAEALRGELQDWPDIHVCDLYPAFLDTPGIQHAANYTGTVLRPAPPVYDPQKIARAIVSLALHPKRYKVTTAAEVMLRIVYAFFPNITRRAAGGVIRGYLKNADSAPASAGNVFEPAEYGSSIHGGWRLPLSPRQRLLGRTVLLAALGIGVALLGSGKKGSSAQRR